MDRWYMKPKRFVGEIEFEGKRAAVKFSVEVSKKGVAKLALDQMPWDMSTKFIPEAFYEQQKVQRFFDFMLKGKARDGSTFQSATVNINSLGSFFSASSCLASCAFFVGVVERGSWPAKTTPPRDRAAGCFDKARESRQHAGVSFPFSILQQATRRRLAGAAGCCSWLDFS